MKCVQWVRERERNNMIERKREIGGLFSVVVLMLSFVFIFVFGLWSLFASE